MATALGNTSVATKFAVRLTCLICRGTASLPSFAGPLPLAGFYLATSLSIKHASLSSK
jgi:hypothetical protein